MSEKLTIGMGFSKQQIIQFTEFRNLSFEETFIPFEENS